MRGITTSLVMVGLLVSLSGCFGTMPTAETGTSVPMPLSVAADANPDSIWVVRQISVGEKVFYGLFACYRKPASQPGAPVCYLAKTAADLKDLSWPNPVGLTGDDVVVPLKEGRPAPAAPSGGVEW